MSMVKSDFSKVGFNEQLGTELTSHRQDVFKFLITSMLLLTAVSIFHVWSRFHIIELNLQIGEAAKQLKELEQEHTRLGLEAESLRTPARIEAIAKQELGMIAPEDQQVILVK